MRKSCLLLPVFLFVVSAIGFTQSNKLLDELLEQKEAGFATSALLVLSAAGIIPEDATLEKAAAALAEQNWGIQVPEEPKAISLGEFAYLLMRAFDIPGGVMYRLLPGPRYAAREIAYLGFIVDRASPYRSLSGEEALDALGMALEWKEDRS
jgi:hypothetical protein